MRKVTAIMALSLALVSVNVFASPQNIYISYADSDWKQQILKKCDFRYSVVALGNSGVACLSM